MTRIVTGLAKGRRLAVPGSGTRPTSDRAREGLFNSLATMLDLDGARALDLYAGSGAVGLEALSRGAASVELVESDRFAAETLRRNVATVGLPGARVVARPVAAVLAARPDEPFDLVFLDPPYALDDAAVGADLAALVDGRWLTADAVVALERSARGDAPPWPDAIEQVRHKRYGEGALWYGRPR